MDVNVKLTTEAMYDDICESYNDAFSGNPGIVQALERLKQSHLPGCSVLDVGCGPGGPASRLIEAGYDVTGIDLSQKMVDYCQKSFDGNFLKIDMTDFEPETQFDAVLSLFNLFHVSHAVIYSMIFKMASWLRPGGTIAIATLEAERIVRDEAQLFKLQQTQYVERFGTEFMGRVVPCTLLTTKEWLRLLQEAGFLIQSVDRHEFQVSVFDYTERQIFFTAKRTHLEPLFGPYPLPPLRRRPHQLSESAWKPLVERLTRHDHKAVLEAVRVNKEVLDVGSGHGQLSVSLAELIGKAYAIEPNHDRNDLLIENTTGSLVEVYQGTAESLPFEDRKFDAAVAVWILHYVDDVEKSLQEMARVVDPTAPNARIVLIQGAPDNELVSLVNKACAGIVEESMPQGESAIDHQGLLLATAARVLTQHGFGDVQLQRVHVPCKFLEEHQAARSKAAANVLIDLWYQDHPRVEDMKAAILPVLEEHFSDNSMEVGDQAVLLVAKPTATEVAVVATI
ncbi:methyltransferase [Cordyceps javanica]|uniref:Methyltransferase n=1 Tax=Cordyceps javanica TaxID=43265 RepID=A0A545V2N4_9HYPO|nr:methyltransferase [Cordyceps javanica]